MPETPDFGQIAQRIAELFGAVGDTEMKTYVAEQLRLVWNARGAADMDAMDSPFMGLGPFREKVRDAIRSVDR